MRKKKAIIFGASSLGKIAFNTLKDKYNICYFADNDEKKWDKLFCGVKIISPQKLNKYKDMRIVIASSYHLEISIQLRELGIAEFSIFDYKENNCEYEKDHDFNIKDEFEDVIKIARTVNIEDSKFNINHLDNNKKLKVACILDEFSYNCFKDECDLIELNPDNWEEVLKKDIDFFYGICMGR